MRRVSLVVVAAGRGERAGGETAKQYRSLCGRMLWEWSALLGERLFGRELVDETVLVVPRGDENLFRNRVRHFRCPFLITAGGKERGDSVLEGVRAASGDVVLVHDGARPFAGVSLCERILKAVDGERGIVPLLPVSDALKREDAEGRFQPVSREGLFAAQTPQGFPRKLLEEAILFAGSSMKDEGEAWVKAGRELGAVEGDRRNMKVTWPGDLALAESQFRMISRTGIGYDIHPLVPGRRFILGGVAVPSFPLGFQGHSDGDPLTHALSDAILGAAGLGDIGTLYPASDTRYRNISSLLILEDVSKRAAGAGWRLEWADMVAIVQEPRLAGCLGAMKEALEGVLPENWKGRLHLKVKSGEGEGTVGSCGAVVCHAAATMSLPSWMLEEGD
ncbi:MAG: 2-C-methyl-D-erythritol 2,4-cyclodiphosphate synthase [Synergistaceae bacterium]|nr:2-C-methyl-D-erythritol 2,4-cyclodiphosphate synthase [Synergistaceae bacterium]